MISFRKNNLRTHYDNTGEVRSDNMKKSMQIIVGIFILLLAAKEDLAQQGVRQCNNWAEFRCGNGNCIPKKWKCNNVNDCGDNSDETITAHPPHISHSTPAT